MSSSHQASKLQIKDFTNLRFVSEAFVFGEAGAMLSDREKLILHFCCMVTTAKLSGMEHRDRLMEKMINDVIRNRCRSLATEDVADILEEVNEEMISGKVMFQHLMEDTKWSMTGERPNKNTNWRDMR
jgi:hypothetical protein